MDTPNFMNFLSDDFVEDFSLHNNGIDTIGDDALLNAIESFPIDMSMLDEPVYPEPEPVPTEPAATAEAAPTMIMLDEPAVHPEPEPVPIEPAATDEAAPTLSMLDEPVYPEPEPVPTEPAATAEEAPTPAAVPYKDALYVGPHLSEAELDEIELAKDEKSTKCATSWGVKRFKDWCVSRDLSPEFEEWGEEELSTNLRKFYGEIRKRDGTEYSRNAMAGLRSAIHRHLTSAPWHRTINIMHGPVFKKANNVLLGSLKISKRGGKDVSKGYDPISTDDMKLLMSSDAFGTDNPQSLQDLVWFSLQFYLCRRGCEGSRDLKPTSFEFHASHNGQPEFVTLRYNEASKNHPGGLQNTNDPQRRLHATGGPLCPVAALKLLISKLDPRCEFLYQRVNAKYEAGSWYLPFPLGIKKIQGMMSRLSVKAGLSRKYTNHCLRAACIKTLMDNGYDPITVTRLSGHRNVASVMSYCKDTTNDVKRQMGESLTAALHGRQAPALPSTSSRPSLMSSQNVPPPALPSTTSTRPSLMSSQNVQQSSSSLQVQEMRSPLITLQNNRQQNAMASVFSNCTITIGSFNYGSKH